MKKTSSYMFVIVGLSLAFSGCKKYLDTLPDNRTVITTPEQVSKLLITAYPKASYVPFTETMSDNAQDKGNAGINSDPQTYKINTEVYRFTDVESTEKDSPANYFYACYKAIAAANQALTYCYGPDSLKYRAQKGEALVARAYAHFMLVALFSPTYDPATAGTDPGIPYVTRVEKDVFAQYDRKTVKYVYDKIEQDLLQGLPLLDERTYGDAPKYHFNLKAAYAFASRFYLFKQDYRQVLKYSELVLGPNHSFGIRNQSQYQKMQYEAQIVLYTQAVEPANLLLQEADTKWYNTNFPFYRFGFGDQMYEKFYKKDNGTGGYFNSNVYTGGLHTLNLPKFNAYSNGKDISSVMPLFTGDEVFFNFVEAKLRLGNYSEALQTMQIWINLNMTKGSVYNAVEFYNRRSALGELPGQPTRPHETVSDQECALRLCLDLKQQAYLQEGLRWFDLLRLKIPVTHEVLGEASIEISATDKRRVLQLPAEAVAAGIPLNPR